MSRKRTPSKMSVSDAGSKGGKTTYKRYGVEHYSELGKKGGKKGGDTTLKRHGREHYQRIGRMGGTKLRNLLQEARDLLLSARRVRIDDLTLPNDEEE